MPDSTSHDYGSKRLVSIKQYKLKELAAIYDVTLYIMRKLLKPHRKKIGRRDGHYYQTGQVKEIFTLVTLPSHIQLIS